jgi:hypothetical protein
MRFLTAFLVVLAAASPAFAEWAPGLDEAEKLSKTSGKLMLVFIYSDQCHVCKGMEKNVWPNIGVETELENWAAVKVEGTAATKSRYRWEVKDVPQLRVIDPEGGAFRDLSREQFPTGSAEKMLDFLKELRAAWDAELKSRVMEWEASAVEAKAKAKERRRPMFYFLTEGTKPAEIALKYPIFLDKRITSASKRFVSVPAPKEQKDNAPLFEKYKPEVNPALVFTDFDGVELHRCAMLGPDDVAAAFEAAYKRFEESQILDPAKALERDLAMWDAALKGDREQDKIDAAQRLIDAKDPKVVKPLSAGFTDASVKLKELLITAMISIDIKSGLAYLLAWVKKEQNNALAVKGWDAVGSTGDLRAVPDLENGILEAPTREQTQARIRALGNMKAKPVVDFLIDLPFKVQGKGRGPGGGKGIHNECSRSLNKLTGQDFGEDFLGWKKWWRDNQKSFKFAE